MALIETSVSGKVGVVAFNRPDKLNAWNAEMKAQFTAALNLMTDDPDVSLIILKGEGKAFSVGADVSKGGTGYQPNQAYHDAVSDWRQVRANVETWHNIWRCSKPVIAQVHGYCMGIATQIAVFSDITLVAEDAVIGWPSLPFGGGLLGPISTWLIGPKRAKEMSFMVGSRMNGTEAVEMGWANHAYPAERLAEATLSMARTIAKTPLDLLMVKKRAINRVMDVQGFSEAVVMGAEFDSIAHASQGAQSTKALVAEVGLKEAMRRFRVED
jgi:enoyl-CoA hydratase